MSRAESAIIDRAKARWQATRPDDRTVARLLRVLVDELVRDVIPFALAELVRQQSLAALDGEDYLRALSTASPSPGSRP